MWVREHVQKICTMKKNPEETHIITKPEGEVATFETCGQQK